VEHYREGYELDVKQGNKRAGFEKYKLASLANP